MTRQEMIKKIEEIKDAVAWDMRGELTDYTRERVFVALDDIIEKLIENEDIKEF